MVVASNNPNTFPTFAGYTIVELLYAGSRTVVYRALQGNEQRPVVIKILKQACPSFSELVQFRNQYTIAKTLNTPGIVRLLGLEPWQNSYALVMEDFGGISLREYAHSFKKANTLDLAGARVPLTEVLTISILLADILHDLSQYRVVHKDIKPANILIHPKSKQVKLIDFSIASQLPKETQTIQNPSGLEGTLAYLAPEQTGRMNRGIDYRTDFYGLGVTLYELLTGQVPFQAKDPLELIHCHIAKQPVPLDQIDATIPATVSTLVLKLMAKNAEDRYQSALGLKHDLEQCLAQWQATETIAKFDLGQRDISDRFLIPEKLYGREREVQTLLDTFDRVAHGSSELMLVAGFSGIGKTAVVNEIHKPITRQQGYFIKGKFDQFNRNIPFSALVQALRSLMGQLHTESDAQLVKWRNQLLEAVGNSGQVLIEVIPELEQLIGKQPAASELSGIAAQNRFNLLFRKFIQVFSTPSHPLVIFLDDLQWADLASLNLLKLLLNKGDRGYLFIIGAYRDNEVSPTHPLMLTLNEITQSGLSVDTIALTPLSPTYLNTLVADTLHCADATTQSLTSLIYQKTQGNPFFSTQFLKTLYEDGWITFDRSTRTWQYDVAQVRQLALTDDVVMLMAARLQKLPTATQDILKLAACISNQFDLATLAIVYEKSQAETASILWKALQEGLILPNCEIYKFYQTQEDISEYVEAQKIPTYRFLHDRVQQAAYSLIPEDQKQATHFKVGQLLIQQLSSQEQADKVFDIVNQLNSGIAFLKTAEEKEKLARLNLRAGQKAKSSTAYAAAVKYFSVARALLDIESWDQAYPLTLAVYEASAEAAYLNTDFEQTEQLSTITLANAQTSLDQVNTYITKIQSHIAQVKLLEAIQIALKALSLLDNSIHLPQQPTPSDFKQALQETQINLADQTSADLLKLPKMSDPHQLAAMRILASTAPPAYFAFPELLPLIAMKMVNLSVKFGNTSTSAFGYAMYGFILCGVVDNIESGYGFGQLALDLVDQFNAQAVKSKVLLLAGHFINPWREPVRESLRLLPVAYQVGLESGDLEFAGYSASFYCFNAIFAGKRLEDLEQEITAYGEAIVRLKQEHVLDQIHLSRQTILNLLGHTEHPCTLVGKAYDEATMVPQHIRANNRTTLAFLYVAKLSLCYLFEDNQQAIAAAAQAETYLDGAVAMLCVVLFHFYDALVKLAQYPHVNDIEKRQLLTQVEHHQARLQHWAENSPANYQHKFWLVAAERDRVLNHKADAVEHYDRAIASAQDNNYRQEAALANELAAKFYLDWGKTTIAAAYMQAAYYDYAKWGAKAKTDDLESRYPELLQPILKPAIQRLNSLKTLAAVSPSTLAIRSTSKTSSSSSSSINDTLDFVTIIKASQVLAGVIQLDELLRQLTQIILQHSGGDYCALVLPDSANQWCIEAIATPENTKLYSTPLADDLDFPVKLIQYVKNTQETVIIEDLETDLPIIDEHLAQQRPQSILGLPILNQGQLFGILYLKNQSTRGVFTEDCLLILNFLCTQAAISLKNAQLYSQAQAQAYDLSQSQQRLKLLIQQTPVAIIEWNIAFEFQAWNPAAEKVFGYSEAEILGRHFRCIIPEEYHDHVDDVATQILSQSGGLYTVNENLTKSGKRIICEWFNAPMFTLDGEVCGGVSMALDISDRKAAEIAIQQKTEALETALEELQQTQLQVVQSEKMSALGNLVAGVAHEINNPVGFLKGNISPAQGYVSDLIGLIDLFLEKNPQLDDDISAEIEAIDLAFIRQDLPDLLNSMDLGVSRIKNISTSLRTFSRADKDYKTAFNLHEGLDSTLLILKHRLKANEQRPAIEIIKNYDDLPMIDCFPGQLNQVFMNILANSIDALDEANQGKTFNEINADPNQITVTTCLDSNTCHVQVSIQDNGTGIPDEIQQHIFDHLYTTKGVGKGTGLGLAIAHQIIVEKHGGTIAVNSTATTGTEFVIELPICLA